MDIIKGVKMFISDNDDRSYKKEGDKQRENTSLIKEIHTDKNMKEKF